MFGCACLTRGLVQGLAVALLLAQEEAGAHTEGGVSLCLVGALGEGAAMSGRLVEELHALHQPLLAGEFLCQPAKWRDSDFNK